MRPAPNWLFVMIPSAVIVAALLLTGLAAGLLSRGPACEGLTALRHLPDDPTAAKRELKKIKAALRSLRPARPYIVIDTHANRIYLRTQDSILLESACSSGSGDTLVEESTGRRWVFDTPRGVFKVTSKISQPWWRKPDWAYIEEGQTPPANPHERLDPNMMGDYALGFGDGYFIHGTIYARLLGVSVTHGCVRVGADDLAKLYRRVTLGTPIYVF